MQPQEHQPLLAGASSAWPAHSSAAAFPACPAAVANSSSVTAFQTCALQQARGQAYPPAVQASSRLDHGPLPPPASRYPSFECSLASHSTGNADLCASFSSMSLSSSGSGLPGCAAARRHDSCVSSGSTDVLLSQRAPSTDRGRQGLYPPLPAQQPDAQAGPQPPPLQQQQQLPSPPPPQQQQQQQQQQQRVLRYPSIDAVTSSGVSVSQASSGCIGPWDLHSSSMNSRAGSVSSTCSSGGSNRYPTLPGPSGNPAGRTVSCLSDAATPAPLQPHILDSWDEGPFVPSAGSSSWQADVLSGREGSVGGEAQAHARQACGLYPVLSGQEGAPEQLQPPPPPLQQQQQQQQPLHTHEAAPWGYDLRVQLQQVSGLPAAGHLYVLVRMHLGGHTEHYRTEPQWSTQQAVYGAEEVFDLCNVPRSVTLECEVWDKSCLSEDSMLGRATWSLAEQLQAAAADDAGTAADVDDILSCDQDTTQGTAAAVCQVVLVLKHPTKLAKTAGQLRLKVVARPSGQEGRPRMVGPVRFRQHLCPTVGMFTGHWATEETMAYSTYKLFLCHISSVFDGVVMRWNPDYDKARMIFEPVLGMTPLVAVLKQQHNAMYATQTGTSRGGVLQSAGDFFRLLNWGIRAGEPRFFTYVLCSDSFRCSETGTNFGIDIVSKHAMHAGGAEEVLYAGEFCIMSCSAAADGYKLVLDNNSGTYSPHKAKLPLLQQLFTSNFPDMEVEVLDWRDPKLEYYHSLCPSRATAAAAQHASAAAAVAAAAAARGKGQQFVAG